MLTMLIAVLGRAPDDHKKDYAKGREREMQGKRRGKGCRWDPTRTIQCQGCCPRTKVLRQKLLGQIRCSRSCITSRYRSRERDEMEFREVRGTKPTYVLYSTALHKLQAFHIERYKGMQGYLKRNLLRTTTFELYLIIVPFFHLLLGVFFFPLPKLQPDG